MKAGCWLAMGLTVAGLLVRLSVRDRWRGFATLFYATPLPLLVFGTAFCLGRALLLQRRRQSVCWAVLLVVLLPWWGWKDFRSGPGPIPGELQPVESVKVLFWNVARKDDLTGAAEYIRQTDADIVALVEVFGTAKERRQFWNEQLPDYDVSILGHGMQLLCKGTAGDAIATNLYGDGAARQLSVHVPHASFECFVVDIDADVIGYRHFALNQLTEMAEEFADTPLLILGDFNTPPDSVHYKNFRKHHQQAFELAGAGYAPTWPLPLPVLHLDQIWVNEHVEVLSCWHGWSSASDHRPVHAILRLRTPDRSKELPAEKSDQTTRERTFDFVAGSVLRSMLK